MTKKEKQKKIEEITQRMVDTAKDRQIGDIPMNDSYWAICNAARAELNALESEPVK